MDDAITVATITFIIILISIAITGAIFLFWDNED